MDYTVLHYIALDYTVLHYIALDYTVLHCIALHLHLSCHHFPSATCIFSAHLCVAQFVETINYSMELYEDF